MARDKGQKIQWPEKKDRQHNGREKGHTIQWLEKKNKKANNGQLSTNDGAITNST